MVHQSNSGESSGANTVLLVLVIILLVGFGVWWFLDQKAGDKEPANEAGINADVTLPEGSNNENTAE